MTRDRINNASFRQKLDPISKNILWRQNPLELVFEDISTFDAENPIIGSLLRELDVGKKVEASNLIKIAPGPPGQNFAIQNRLNKLNKLRDFEPELRNNNNSNNDLSPAPSPLPFSPGAGPFIPPPPLSTPFQPPPSIFDSCHLQDLIILLKTFISQHNFHLQISAAKMKDYLEILLVH